MKDYKTSIGILSILSLVILMTISCGANGEILPSEPENGIGGEIENTQSLESNWDFVYQEDLMEEDFDYLLNYLSNPQSELVSVADYDMFENNFLYYEDLTENGVDQNQLDEVVGLILESVDEPVEERVAFACSTFTVQVDGQLEEYPLIAFHAQTFAENILNQLNLDDDFNMPDVSCGQGSCVGPMVGPGPRPKAGPSACPRVANTNFDSE